MSRAPLLLGLLATRAWAAPVAGPVVAAPGASLPDDAERAFALGVADLAPPAETAAASPDLEPAAASLAAGERAYLEGRMTAAEKALAGAAERWLDHASALADAGAATRAVLLLAQVRAALGRQADADRVLERALKALPGFPAGAAPPPPAVQRRLDALRERLRPQMQARLDVRSRPSGVEVRLNGVPAGRTPVALEGLPPATVRVRVGGRTRDVDLAQGAQVVQLELDAVPAREALRGTLLRPDADAGWSAAARLQAAGEGDGVCVAVATDDGRVLVARLSASAREVVGARRAAGPSQTEGWRALGRLCGDAVPSDGPRAEVASILWPAEFDAPANDGRRLWGWTALGAGAALAGVGLVYGLGALDAEAEFRGARTAEGARRARDEARHQAVVTDVSLGLSAGLLGAALYLFLAPEP